MPEMIDLDDVLLTEGVYTAWGEVVRRAVWQYRNAGIRPPDVPDEQGRIKADGTLTIFCALPNGREIAMRVPPGEWVRRQ